jgi:hypothetical protein
LRGRIKAEAHDDDVTLHTLHVELHATSQMWFRTRPGGGGGRLTRHRAITIATTAPDCQTAIVDLIATTGIREESALARN